MKDFLDSLLSRAPRLYLAVERRRRWLNWDRRVYLTVIRRGDVVLDVGANVGGHTVTFSRLAGRRGRVLAYEPVPSNYRRLLENLSRRAPLGNVNAYALAVGAEGEVEAVIHVPGDDGTQASLRRHGADSWKNAESVASHAVAVTTVDAEVRKHGLSRVDFVKLDVEGGELDVIRGAAGTISRFQPFIYCEIYAPWTRAFGYQPRDLVNAVASHGYSAARVIKDGQLTVATASELMGADFSVSSNVLFVPTARTADVSALDAMLSRSRPSAQSSSR